MTCLTCSAVNDILKGTNELAVHDLTLYPMFLLTNSWKVSKVSLWELGTCIQCIFTMDLPMLMTVRVLTGAWATDQGSQVWRKLAQENQSSTAITSSVRGRDLVSSSLIHGGMLAGLNSVQMTKTAVSSWFQRLLYSEDTALSLAFPTFGSFPIPLFSEPCMEALWYRCPF